MHYILYLYSTKIISSIKEFKVFKIMRNTFGQYVQIHHWWCIFQPKATILIYNIVYYAYNFTDSLISCLILSLTWTIKSTATETLLAFTLVGSMSVDALCVMTALMCIGHTFINIWKTMYSFVILHEIKHESFTNHSFTFPEHLSDS